MADDVIPVSTITQLDARKVLGYLGLAPGAKSNEGAPKEDSFAWHLVAAMMLADEWNLERLARGYEGLASAVRLYRDLPRAGVAQLREIGWPGPF